MEATPRLYHEPPPSEAHLYEQRGDGCFYYVGGPQQPIFLDGEDMRLPSFEGAGYQPQPGRSAREMLMEEMSNAANQVPLVAPTEYIKCSGAPVGDLDSDEKGTGARFNAGKVPMNYIPFEQQLIVLSEYRRDPQHGYIFALLESLAQFEKGECSITDIVSELEITDLHAAAFVWEYGAHKYKAFNWMKGMPWSVPLGCISRHAQAIIVEGEELDPESGCEHWGHIVCNLLMLDHYSRYYPEGDDRPPREYFNG